MSAMNYFYDTQLNGFVFRAFFSCVEDYLDVK